MTTEQMTMYVSGAMLLLLVLSFFVAQLLHRHKPQEARAESAHGEAMAVIAYFFFLIPMISGDSTKSPYVKYHVNQGALLFLAEMAFTVFYIIVMVVCINLHMPNKALAWLGLLWLFPISLWGIGVGNASSGKMKPLPLIGKFTLIH